MLPQRIPGLRFDMSPRPDTHDSTSSSVVMAAAAGAPTPPADDKTAETQQSVGHKGSFEQHAGAVIENPYLAGLGKKTRGLKKKMEKIKKTETLSASGKVGSEYNNCNTAFICAIILSYTVL